jgi:hypothetical protein
MKQPLPDYVLKYKTKGYAIRQIANGNFVLFKVSSHRVAGKNYPVLSQEYIGIITPNGLLQKKRLVSSSIEFGLSYFIYRSFYNELNKHIFYEGNIISNTTICAAICFFIFGDISDDLLALSYLPYLAKVSSFSLLTERRIKNAKILSKLIDTLFDKLVPSAADKYLLLAHLRNLNIESNSDAFPQVSSSLQELLDKYAIGIKYVH